MPDFVKKYKAPKKIEQNPAQVTCEYEGDGRNYVSLKKGDKSATFYVRNYKTDAVDIKYAYIEELEDAEYYSTGMVICGDIQVGDEESKVMDYFNQFEWNIRESNNISKYYYITNDITTAKYCISIDKKGKVESIKMLLEHDLGL